MTQKQYPWERIDPAVQRQRAELAVKLHQLTETRKLRIQKLRMQRARESRGGGGGGST